jgi:DNA-binding response OmpR family regulator
LCRQIREESDLPILFLSAREHDTDKIRGLSLGADDYIVKTATPGEVVARIKAVLRRTKGELKRQKIPRLTSGEIEVDVQAHDVWIRGEQVPFTAKEYALLTFLLQHPQQVFTYDQLLEQVWGDVYSDHHTVRVYIARIRNKIEKNPADPEYIQTIWGMGYKWNGPRGG